MYSMGENRGVRECEELSIDGHIVFIVLGEKAPLVTDLECIGRPRILLPGKPGGEKSHPSSGKGCLKCRTVRNSCTALFVSSQAHMYSFCTKHRASHTFARARSALCRRTVPRLRLLIASRTPAQSPVQARIGLPGHRPGQPISPPLRRRLHQRLPLPPLCYWHQPTCPRHHFCFVGATCMAAISTTP
jgi:hypothetical protein